MKKRRHDMAESAVVTECSAFLTGTLAEQLEAQGQQVPVWVWTNLLAHGDEALILETIARTRHRLLNRNWWTVRTDLIKVILDITHWNYSLDELQKSVLIPLELDLASRSDVVLWSPQEWANAVTHSLRRQNQTDLTS